MLSKNQQIEKLEKVKKVVNLFLSEDNLTINDISKITGIASSSVQRYLHDPFILEIFGTDAEQILSEIEMKLKQNSDNGRILGGQVFSNNNTSLKDENGHFIGSIKK